MHPVPRGTGGRHGRGEVSMDFGIGARVAIVFVKDTCYDTPLLFSEALASQ